MPYKDGYADQIIQYAKRKHKSVSSETLFEAQTPAFMSISCKVNISIVTL
jgi:hypothetical protein